MLSSVMKKANVKVEKHAAFIIKKPSRTET
jgi:hypothetical protein